MAMRNRSRADIAITGMACRFADSANPAALWNHIMRRNQLFSPLTTLPQHESGAPRKNIFDRPFPGSGALLGDLYACQPADQTFPPKLNNGENPDVFFCTQLVIEALRDSGMKINSLPTDCVSLRLGYSQPFNIATINWLQHTLFINQTIETLYRFLPAATQAQFEDIRAKLNDSLPPPTPYALISAMGVVIASWIAQQLGFAGPALMVDAGAVSGQVALQGAMDDLIMRRADIALAGAVQPPFNRPLLQGLSGTLPFSRNKTLLPFSRNVDGTLPGEGGAAVVLKRLKDAQRDHDRIYAIIRGNGMSASSTIDKNQVPTTEGLARAIERALHAARLTPDSIQMIEGHGSCIPHSDTTEITTLQDVFARHKTTQPCIALGSIKGNIGHTLCASSMAGIVKAALSLHHAVLAPGVAVDKPHPKLPTACSPIYLATEARPWIRGGRKRPRCASVIGIDLTGNCAATILEESPERK